MDNDGMESRIYSTMSTEQGFKLYDLTSRMNKQATQILDGYRKNNVLPIVDNSRELAETVLEFLKVSGWTK